MANIYDMVDTWNDSGTTFTAIKMNVTDTASASGSLLFDVQLGGAKRFSVPKTGGWMARGSATDTDFYGQPSTTQGYFVFGYGGGVNDAFAFNWNQEVVFGSSYAVGWSSVAGPTNVGDLFLRRDAANTLAQRNGTNAQTFNLYNTWSDASNYERARFGWNANVFEIAPQAAGTGSTRVLHISGLPTSNPGAGILWNDSGTVKVGT